MEMTVSQHIRGHDHPRRPEVPLDTVDEGTIVKVTRVRGGRGVCHRLREMGLGVGETVTVVKNHRPGGVVVDLLDSRLCLGRGAAHKVYVEEL